MKRALLHLATIFLLATAASAGTCNSSPMQPCAPPDTACTSGKFCQMWPVTGVTYTPPVSRGWLRMFWDPLRDGIAYWGGDSWGTVTMSTSWYLYHPPTDGSGNRIWRTVADSAHNPWKMESTCGERGPTFSAAAQDRLLSGTLIGTNDTKINLCGKLAGWTATHAYSVGDVIRPNAGSSYVWRVTVAGTSGATAPSSWPNSVGSTVTDGGVTWVNAGACTDAFSALNPPSDFNWNSTPVGTGMEIPAMILDDEEVEYCDLNYGTWTMTVGDNLNVASVARNSGGTSTITFSGTMPADMDSWAGSSIHITGATADGGSSSSVTSLTRASNIVTVVMQAPVPALNAGGTVVVSGTTHFDGTYPVDSFTDQQHFTFFDKGTDITDTVGEIASVSSFNGTFTIASANKATKQITYAQTCGTDATCPVSTTTQTASNWNVCHPNSAKRAIRGTYNSCHAYDIGWGCDAHVNGWAQQACPAPYSGAWKNGGTLQPATRHIIDRHPYRNMAYDSTHGWWWQYDSKTEVGELTDTQYYDPSATTPVWTPLPNAGTVGRTDGGLEYDPDHQVLIQYGGSHSGAVMDTTQVMCLDASLPAGDPDNPAPGTAAALGCIAQGTTQNPTLDMTHPWLYKWNVLPSSGATALGCVGSRWGGSVCSDSAYMTSRGPGTRQLHSMTYDTRNHVFVMFGGTSEQTGGVVLHHRTAVGSYCNGPITSSPPYQWAYLATVNGYQEGCPAAPNDVWLYEASTRTWRQAQNTGDVPAPTKRPAIAYNPVGGYFALWAGPVSGTPQVGQYQSGMYKLVISCTPDCINPGSQPTATWTLTNVGAGSDPQPPRPESVTYAPTNPGTGALRGCLNNDLSGVIDMTIDPWAKNLDLCDHVLENLMYDAVGDMFIYGDGESELGSSALQIWHIPASAIATSTQDTTPPTVSMTAPSNDATVSGSVALQSTASDVDSAILKVEYYLDGTTSKVGEAPSSPYTYNWDSTTTTNGAHNLRAKAIDGAPPNLSTWSSVVNVTVSNAALDTTPPTVSITTPSNNQVVSGSITMTATASDVDSAVSKVEYFLDGTTSLGSATSSPYSVAWNTALYGNGAHTLTATATDAAPPYLQGSNAINVTVNNTAGTATSLTGNSALTGNASIPQ